MKYLDRVNLLGVGFGRDRLFGGSELVGETWPTIKQLVIGTCVLRARHSGLSSPAWRRLGGRFSGSRQHRARLAMPRRTALNRLNADGVILRLWRELHWRVSAATPSTPCLLVRTEGRPLPGLVTRSRTNGDDR